MKNSLYLTLVLFIHCVSCNENSGIYEPKIISVLPRSSGIIKWEQTNGPYGGYVYSLVAKDNGHLFAGADNGVYVSQNNGDCWKLSQIRDVSIRTIVSDLKGNIYTSANGYLQISSDNGVSWISKILKPSISIYAIYVNAGGEIYLASCFKGILHSTNYGDSWREDTIMTKDCIRSIAINSKGNLFISSFLDGIYSSNDNCKTWKLINNSNLNKYYSSLYISKDDDIYACSDLYGIHLSKDNGLSWSEINRGLDDIHIKKIFMNSSGKMFAGTLNGIYSSADKGQHWISSGLKDNTIYSIAEGQNKYIFAATDRKGIYRSPDRGISWEEADRGIINTFITQVAVNSRNHIFAHGGGNGLFYSTDNGNSWEKRNSEFFNSDFKSLLINSKDYIFATTYGKIYLSKDNCRSWTQISLSSGDSYNFYMIKNPKDNLYFSNSSGKIFLLNKNGDSWKEIAGINEKINSFYITSNGHIFINSVKYSGIDTETFDLLYSSDEGSTWVKIDLPEEYHSSYRVTGNTKGYIFAYSGRNLLRIIHDNGTLKSEIIKFESSFISSLIINENNEIRAATHNGDIYLSNDDGNSWNKYTSENQNMRINSIAEGPEGFIYAGTGGNGVFRGKF